MKKKEILNVTKLFWLVVYTYIYICYGLWKWCQHTITAIGHGRVKMQESKNYYEDRK